MRTLPSMSSFSAGAFVPTPRFPVPLKIVLNPAVVISVFFIKVPPSCILLPVFVKPLSAVTEGAEDIFTQTTPIEIIISFGC